MRETRSNKYWAQFNELCASRFTIGHDTETNIIILDVDDNGKIYLITDLEEKIVR